MTEADLARIEGGLSLTVPKDYRDLMLFKAAELRSITHEIRGSTCEWFEEKLYLEADRVIITNLIERKPDSGTAYAFPQWWKTFLLVGSNGAGDYYCLRLDRGHTVWMIGSDCGGEPSVTYPTLLDFVEENLREYHERFA